MGRPKSRTFTDAELRIMDALWRRGRATVGEIHEDLARHGLAYTTVLTTLQMMEGKGYVAHDDTKGRAYVYRPRVARGKGQRGAIRDVVKRWFGNSPNALLLNVIEEHELSEEEVAELIKLLRRKGKK